MMGYAAFIMPLLVATSALGSLSCHIMTSSRLCFVGARQGHFPDCLSLITIDKNLPKPSLIFLVSLPDMRLHGKSYKNLKVRISRRRIIIIVNSLTLWFLGNSFHNISVRWRYICVDKLCFICGIELHSTFRTRTSLLTVEETRNEPSN